MFLKHFSLVRVGATLFHSFLTNSYSKNLVLSLLLLLFPNTLVYIWISSLFSLFFIKNVFFLEEYTISNTQQASESVKFSWPRYDYVNNFTLSNKRGIVNLQMFTPYSDPQNCFFISFLKLLRRYLQALSLLNLLILN